VTLTSSDSRLTVPSSVTVAYGVASAGFTATAGAVWLTSQVAIAADLNGSSVTVNLILHAPSRGVTQGSPSPGVLAIEGTPSEVSGTANGATVTPTTAPPGLTGQLNVRGNGSVNFVSRGVAFELGGFQNAYTAFYTFTGAQLQSVFNVNQGQISFNLTSSYNLDARLQSPQNTEQVFDGFDNSQDLFLFQVQATMGRLGFVYNTGGTIVQSYWFPAGTEDTLFGQGVTAQVKLAWSGGSLNLYLNGTLVNTTPYTPALPNWTSTSSFTLGADDPHAYGGGYFSCVDPIGGFQALNLAGNGPN